MTDTATSTLSSLRTAYTTATTAETFTSESDSLTRLSDDFDTFLQLLTTQMVNQDPLEPMDSSEFTNQLVAFAEAEQAVKQSGLLEDLVGGQSLTQSVNATSYIGMEVKTQGSNFVLNTSTVENEDGEEEELPIDEILTYTLPEEASSAVMNIYDETGLLVRQSDLDREPGTYNVTWDGSDNNNDFVEAGNYSFQVTAKDANGDLIEGITYEIRGTVNNVLFDGENTTLTVDDRQIRLEDISAVGYHGSI